MASTLPDAVEPLDPGQPLRFACHPGVPCFTECCRLLELELTPYDVLRLKRHLGMPSDAFLERYAVVEDDPQAPYPRCFLGMRGDDPAGRCVFVQSGGCRVYPDRPGACRSYPVARGAFIDRQGRVGERFALVREPHCRGFAEATTRPVREYLDSQGMGPYNQANDRLLGLLHHPRFREGYRLPPAARRLFLLALFDLDRFRGQAEALAQEKGGPRPPDRVAALDDEALLAWSARWLTQVLLAA